MRVVVAAVMTSVPAKPLVETLNRSRVPMTFGDDDEPDPGPRSEMSREKTPEKTLLSQLNLNPYNSANSGVRQEERDGEIPVTDTGRPRFALLRAPTPIHPKGVQRW
jgi:hypothetical protein